MKLAEIVAEARRLEDAIPQAEHLETKYAWEEDRDRFYAEHFPRLARVAEAAATMRNNIAELTQFGCQPSNADIVDELERFDAAVRGEEETNGQP